MRLSTLALLVGFALPSAALAQQYISTECQDNLLSGRTTFTDATTGEDIVYQPLPTVPTTGVYPNNVTFNLGTTGGGYIAPATTTTIEPYPAIPQPVYPLPGGGNVATPSDILNGTSWSLVQVDGRRIRSSGSVTFNADGSFGGSAPCNTYGGSFTAFSNFTLQLGNVFSTRRACPDLPEEQAYLRALNAVTEFRLGREGDTLALLDGAGASRVLYERPGANPFPPSGSITGMWRVAGVVVNGQFQTDSGFGMPSFEFRNDGRFSANLGCNTASGTYTLNGLDLRFGPIAVTARQCIVPAPFEGPILDALSRIIGLRNMPGGVSLVDLNGTELIRLIR